MAVAQQRLQLDEESNPVDPNGTVFAARDANIAVAADFAGRIHYTSDGGTTWSTAFEYSYGDLGFFDFVKYLDSNTVIALGDADANGLCVAKSTDGGATWVRLTNLPAEEASPEKWFSYATYHSAGDVYNGIFWCSLYARSGTWPRILKTTDAGATWTSWEIHAHRNHLHKLTICAHCRWWTRTSVTRLDRASGGFLTTGCTRRPMAA